MTTEELVEAGYEITNVRITNVDLSMKDYGCLTLNIGMEGHGWSCVYGGICIGHGYLGSCEFDGTPKGLEYIMRIMDTVGVEQLSDLKGKYCRIAVEGWGDPVKIIGNIIEEKWFDAGQFFAE